MPLLSLNTRLFFRVDRPGTAPAVRCLLALWCLVLAALAMPLAFASDRTPEPGYVGSTQCRACHESQYEAWRGSHHDLAMAEAREGTVLGDFDQASVTAHGVTSTFYRKDGGYFVRTDGPEGRLEEYKISHVFGWAPLQQYLIELSRGRLQALGLAWDSRPAGQGGQRWFHLYPDEEMDHRHPLHWTARDQNWNYQCAECHSTNLKKGYDPSGDSFETTWSEIDVACEACHGPGSRHLEQARALREGDAHAWDDAKGLAVDLSDRDGGRWEIDAKTGVPQRIPARADRTEVELCARCHSRRGLIHEAYSHGAPLADTHRLALLDEHLYFPDGQIKDEVYVHGSFLQSRMYAAGVTCTDCHDPHGLNLRAEGDLVCARCHGAGRYDSPGHHHHPPGSSGASCRGCHMPQRTYMVNDERADHSMRVPRPDLSLELGTPNACSQCHLDKPLQWAADAFADWYGEEVSRRPHFGRRLHAGRTGAPGAGGPLLALAADGSEPAIVRATALDLLGPYLAGPHLFTVRRLLADEDPLVRGAAVRLMELAGLEGGARLLVPLLRDPIRTVRLEAARVLAPLLRPGLAQDLPPKVRSDLESAVGEYLASQRVNAERPESHLNMGLIEAARGDAAAAARAYRSALRLDPRFAPGFANLADLYRAQGREGDAERVLREGLEAVPGSAALHHGLGLLLVRRQRLEDALPHLRQAAELAPDHARYAYVEALALHGLGRVPEALEQLERARREHPRDRDILVALVSFNRDLGEREVAAGYARQLVEQHPEDPGARQLLDDLGTR